jgi:succinate dehydrogenase/fumarate reductase flavoprotein subunit
MTRDRLSQAIMSEILEGRGVEGGVILDIGSARSDMLKSLRSMLPAKTPSNKTAFIVSPTTHFCMGGIVTDELAETMIPGLFAAGEASAGTHGANRLAGNALAEVFAMGRVAGRCAARRAAGFEKPALSERDVMAEKERLKSLVSAGDQTCKALRLSLKEVMWFRAGIIRDGKNLKGALDRIDELKHLMPKIHIENIRELTKLLELRNMLLLAEVVCRTALKRTESRGAHFRSDCPGEDNGNLLMNIHIAQKEGKMHLETVPANIDNMKPEIG